MCVESRTLKLAISKISYHSIARNGHDASVGVDKGVDQYQCCGQVLRFLDFNMYHHLLAFTAAPRWRMSSVTINFSFKAETEGLIVKTETQMTKSTIARS